MGAPERDPFLDAAPPPLAVRARRALAWVAGGRVAARAVSFLSTVALARLLAPSDYGVVAMANAVLALAELLGQGGLGAVVVQRRALATPELSTMFWTNVGAAAALAVGAIAAAPLVGAFFGDARVVPVLRALALAMPIDAAATIPRALLVRELQFRSVFLRATAAAGINGAVAIGCAAGGLGVWSLVAGNLAGRAAGAALLWRAAPFRPRLYARAGDLRGALGFGANVLAADLLQYVHRHLDAFVIGRLFGTGALGLYALGTRLMLVPIQEVAGTVGQVLSPALAELRDEPARARRAFLAATGAIALVSFPLMVGLAAVAPDFIAVFYGARWVEIAPVVRVLAIAGAIQSVAGVRSVFLSRERPDLARRWAVATTAAYAASYFAGAPWGLEGIAAAYTAAAALLWPIGQSRAGRLIGLPVAESLLRLGPTAACAVAMAWVVAAVRALPPVSALPLAARLLVSVAAGAVAYAALLAAARPAAAREALAVWRRK